MPNPDQAGTKRSHRRGRTAPPPIEVTEASLAPEERVRTGPYRKVRGRSNAPFFAGLIVITAFYVLMIAGLIVADISYMAGSGDLRLDLPGYLDWIEGPVVDAPARLAGGLLEAMRDPKIRYSIQLTLISCTMTAILSLFVAAPVGYLTSRFAFPGRSFDDAVLDIPIVLPPLVVGISLLILFQFMPAALRDWMVYERPAVILAQFMVACAFAVRTMRATFDQIDTRRENVAMTLGCTRWQAFCHVVMPEARGGLLTAANLAWARALGEFGPILIFAGATRNKTEVLSTTVFLELSIGDLTSAVAVSLLMVTAAVIVLMITRIWGSRSLSL